MKRRNSNNKRLLRLAEKFQPWDYKYLLDLEKQVLQQMLEHHNTADIIVDHKKIAKQINLAIKLLNISDETEMAYRSSGSLFKDSKEEYKDWVNVYVNTNNWKRFVCVPQHINIDWSKPCMQHYLRMQKAWYLYNKLRFYCMQWWWS